VVVLYRIFELKYYLKISSLPNMSVDDNTLQSPWVFQPPRVFEEFFLGVQASLDDNYRY
jgi:hypothetical protein